MSEDRHMKENDREKLVLDKSDARTLLWQEEDNEYKVISNEIVDTLRTDNVYKLVIQRKSDGKFFGCFYNSNAVEGPMAYDDPEFMEVFPVEKTIIEYI